MQCQCLALFQGRKAATDERWKPMRQAEEDPMRQTFGIMAPRKRGLF